MFKMEEAVLMELKMFFLQVNLTLQMKIVEQEKEIEELKKQLSLLSQDRRVKDDTKDGSVPVSPSSGSVNVSLDF